MTLTRDFKDTIKARAERDPKFRAALRAECKRLSRHPEVRAKRASKGDGR